MVTRIVGAMSDDFYQDHDGHYWSGNPNQALVAQLTPLEVPENATALDIGAGEGADAVWLSQRGYIVTALEPSTIGCGRIMDVAAHANQPVAIINDTFEVAYLQTYDLVSVFYTPLHSDDDTVTKLLSLVAPGGYLIVVHHDAEVIATIREGENVADFLLPEVLHGIVTTQHAGDFTVKTFGQFERTVSHGMGAGIHNDWVLLLQRNDH